MNRYCFLFVIAASNLLPLATEGQVLLPPARPLSSEISFADFNADGRADLAWRSSSAGAFGVYLNNGTGFQQTVSFKSVGQAVPWTGWDVMFADMNGDGRADLINRDQATGAMYVHYNNGSGFAQYAVPPNGFEVNGISPAHSGWRTLISDVNGDQRADICNINLTNGDVFIHKNKGGYFISPHDIFSPGLAVTASPYWGWEHQLADLDGNGFAEFVNVNRSNLQFFGHAGNGNSFETHARLLLAGPTSVYEFEYFLVDVTGDGTSDIVQHNLRTGEVIGFETINHQQDVKQASMKAKFRHQGPGHSRPYRGLPIPELSNRSLDVLMFYDDDHLPWAQTPVPDITDRNVYCPSNGWPRWPLNPNEPNDVPAGGDNYYRYRTADPLLGLYRSDDPLLIKQHAYWLASLGVTGIVVDWTNYEAPYVCPEFEIKLRKHTAHNSGCLLSHNRVLSAKGGCRHSQKRSDGVNADRVASRVARVP